MSNTLFPASVVQGDTIVGGPYDGYSVQQMKRDLQAGVRRIEAEDPVFRKFSRKIYDTDTYADHMSYLRDAIAVYSEDVMDTTVRISRGQIQDDHVTTKDRLTFILLRLYEYPYYVVTQELYDTLMNTDLPEDFAVEELELGFPAAFFVLPETDLSIRAICVTDVQPRYMTDDVGVEFHQAFDDGTLTTENAPLGFTFYRNHLWDAVYSSWAPRDRLREHMETAIPEEALVFKLLHFLNSKKEYVSEETFVRRARKSGRTIWKPRILGTSYNKQFSDRLKSEPTGRHVALHLRRGHYKLQPHGPGRTLRKRILIDPYWAGGSQHE